MNDLQKELQELKAKVAKLESRIVAEPVKWQPEGGDWAIDIDGCIMESVSDELIISFGVVRQTKEQAQRASVEMRRFNRMLALRDELCGDEVVDWTDNESNKWILYFYYQNNEWTTGKNQYMQSVTPYFTTKEAAQKACDMLNSGEVEL